MEKIISESAISEPRLLQMVSYWTAKKGAHRHPARADIDPIDIPKLLPNLLLVDIVTDPRLRFHFRVVGTAVVELYGSDFTKKYLDEIDTGGFQNVIESGYTEAYELDAPVFQSGTSLYRKDFSIAYERTVLPLGPPDGAPDMLLVGTFFKWPTTKPHLAGA